MRRYFAIIAAMRTGSNLLEKTIEGFGDTVCYGEAFNPCFIGGPRRSTLPHWSIDDRNAQPLAMLEAMISAEPLLIPGFRIFDGHQPKVLEAILKDPRCSRIVLRRDPVESYVSLLIAQQTDQWLLRNAKRRRTAQVHFDPAEFEIYRKGIQTHYQRIEDELARAGQDALFVDYEDLTNRDVLLRIAGFLGTSGKPPEKAPLLRQNPGSLADKVLNYGEMCAALGRDPQPKASPATAPVSNDLYAPETLPLVYAPIAGPAEAPVLALLQRLEAQAHGEKHLPRNEVLKAVDAGALFPRLTASQLANGPQTAFTMVCHPALRAHGLFAWQLFGPNWRDNSARAAVEAVCPDLATPSQVDGSAWQPRHHGAAFDAFLDYLLSAKQGSALAPALSTQKSTIDAYREGICLETVLHLEDFGAACRKICGLSSQAPFPPGQQRAIRSIAGNKKVNAAAVLTPDRLTRIADLWPSDYDAFGYDLAPAALGPHCTPAA